mmetsp:Transcript_13877/g.27927  ORF Transcript_13877/g.27927 Transcript_13877/m.27927 type:complete len:205 (-) Transcript_13877:495-1109(-)
MPAALPSTALWRRSAVSAIACLSPSRASKRSCSFFSSISSCSSSVRRTSSSSIRRNWWSPSCARSSRSCPSLVLSCSNGSGTESTTLSHESRKEEWPRCSMRIPRHRLAVVALYHASTLKRVSGLKRCSFSRSAYEHQSMAAGVFAQILKITPSIELMSLSLYMKRPATRRSLVVDEKDGNLIICCGLYDDKSRKLYSRLTPRK